MLKLGLDFFVSPHIGIPLLGRPEFAAMYDIIGLPEEGAIDLSSEGCDLVRRQFIGYPEVTLQASSDLFKLVSLVTNDVQSQ